MRTSRWGIWLLPDVRHSSLTIFVTLPYRSWTLTSMRSFFVQKTRISGSLLFDSSDGATNLHHCFSQLFRLHFQPTIFIYFWNSYSSSKTIAEAFNWKFTPFPLSNITSRLRACANGPQATSSGQPLLVL